MPERIQAVESWIDGHEKLCAERFGDIRDDMRWLKRGVIGLVLSIAAWLAIQIYNINENRLNSLEHPSPVTVVQSQAPAAPR